MNHTSQFNTFRRPNSYNTNNNNKTNKTNNSDNTYKTNNSDNTYKTNNSDNTYKTNNSDNELTNEQKGQLIEYIYSSTELSRFKYKILEVEDDLQQLDVNKYIVSANFTGPNCLLVFIKIKDKFYSHLIDRKTLSYNPSQINLNNLKTIRVRVALEQKIYDGTIFDGILIQNNGNKTFIITDCYYLRGKNLCNDQLTYKLINIKSYLDANYDSESKLNTINLNVNKTYDLSNISTLINIDIPKTKTTSKNFQIRGITFHPLVSGTKLIYLFGNETKSNNQPINQSNNQSNNQPNNQSINQSNNQSINQSNNQSINQIKKKVNISYICKTNEPIYAILEIKKTETIDVYKLFAVEKCIRDNKTVLKSKKMGIAYIPTDKCSNMCKILINSNNPRILMKCQFIQSKNKWMPVEQDLEHKIPSYVVDIEKNMEIIEEAESDSE